MASDVFQSYSAGTETKLQIVAISKISVTHFKGHETAGFECMLSCLPSVTSVGMASLLPHKEMQVDGSLNVTVGVSFLLALLFRTCGVLLCIHYIFLRTDCIILKNIACS